MNIGIFETENFEATYPLIRLFDSPGNKLIIFTNAYTYQPLKDLLKDKADDFTWVIRRDDESLYGFLTRTYKEVRRFKTDLFYCNTISSNHLLFALLFKALHRVRVVVTIHDINCVFRSKAGPGFKNLVRHIGKKLLIRQVKEFNVISDTMLPYMHSVAGKGKTIHNIPGGIYEFNSISNTIQRYIRIVVPGTIDKKRRDYTQVLDLLHISENLSLPLEIVLLGAPYLQYGKDILKQARDFKSVKSRVVFYETPHVDQIEFSRQMDLAHFVFIPQVIQTAICGNIPETYGITKSSGNIFDVIKHARPFIIPQVLQIPGDMESSCFRYENMDQLGIFLKSIAGDSNAYMEWEEKAVQNSRNYSVENVKRRNLSLFTGMPLS